jgi:phosphohistidine phosphatase
MKTLYLVRHAKSSWKDQSLSDQQRPLNKRGHTSALAMGERLRKHHVEVELLYSSPALRALTTARYLADAINYDHEKIQIDSDIYFSGIDAMLQLVQECDPEINTMMLVGHNPDMTAFLNFLCGYQTSNMPTCSIATIEFNVEWKKIAQSDGTLVDYDYPKKM